jgi:hypothetical protein
LADLYIHDIPESVRRAFKASAVARGFNQGEMFVRLVRFHERACGLLSRADARANSRELVSELQQFADELKLTDAR